MSSRTVLFSVVFSSLLSSAVVILTTMLYLAVVFYG